MLDVPGEGAKSQKATPPKREPALKSIGSRKLFAVLVRARAPGNRKACRNCVPNDTPAGLSALSPAHWAGVHWPRFDNADGGCWHPSWPRDLRKSERSG